MAYGHPASAGTVEGGRRPATPMWKRAAPGSGRVDACRPCGAVASSSSSSASRAPDSSLLGGGRRNSTTAHPAQQTKNAYNIEDHSLHPEIRHLRAPSSSFPPLDRGLPFVLFHSHSFITSVLIRRVVLSSSTCIETLCLIKSCARISRNTKARIACSRAIRVSTPMS